MATRELIQRIEIGSAGASSIDFANIPSTYDDLALVLSARNTFSNNSEISGVFLRFNGSTSNYSNRVVGYMDSFGARSSANQYNITNATLITQIPGAGSTSSVFGNSTTYIPNYTKAIQKSISSEAASSQNSTVDYSYYIGSVSGLWADTSPVRSISLFTGTTAQHNFVQYSSASLYGIKRGSDGKTEVASGGTITTSGGYTYHTFTSSGTFVANRNLTADILVVAGGGSGFYSSGNGGVGGGGAGGYLAFAAQSLSPQSYSCVVGAGGASSVGTGSAGSNSYIAGLTSAIGGGTGGSNTSGTSGGSGGGAGESQDGGLRSGGAATSGQGYPGGGNTYNFDGAGGGGAGSAGQSPTSTTTAGNGGSGATWLNGTTYAGGGGGSGYSSGSSGGQGGTGGGGNGTINPSRTVATPGQANTGSGGGALGGSLGYSGNTAGGSGIIIVRYLTPA